MGGSTPPCPGLRTRGRAVDHPRRGRQVRARASAWSAASSSRTRASSSRSPSAASCSCSPARPFSVVLVLLFNLISDLTGGVRVTVLQEDAHLAGALRPRARPTVNRRPDDAPRHLQRRRTPRPVPFGGSSSCRGVRLRLAPAGVRGVRQRARAVRVPRATSSEIIAFAVVVVLGPPVLLWCLEGLVGLASRASPAPAAPAAPRPLGGRVRGAGAPHRSALWSSRCSPRWPWRSGSSRSTGGSPASGSGSPTRERRAAGVRRAVPPEQRHRPAAPAHLDPRHLGRRSPACWWCSCSTSSRS